MVFYNVNSVYNLQKVNYFKTFFWNIILKADPCSQNLLQFVYHKKYIYIYNNNMIGYGADYQFEFPDDCSLIAL